MALPTCGLPLTPLISDLIVVWTPATLKDGRADMTPRPDFRWCPSW